MDYRAHPRKSKDKLSNDDVSGSASITRLADTVMSVSHGVVDVMKDRNEGKADIQMKFTYYPDCRLCVDCKTNDPLYCSWDREGVEPPNRKAIELYAPVEPDLMEYPL